ncbi:MAG: hypothetical protein JWS12_102 [Candidatus Saccharibacteria bacterium]|nr:hypothetical protein [Candidatus Saccharibacteria bacterium]
MHGLLVSNAERTTYEITGITGYEYQSFEERDLAALIGNAAVRSNVVLELPGMSAPDYLRSIPRSSWAGLYIGEAFAEDTVEFGLTEPLKAGIKPVAVPGGVLWLETTQAIYHHTDTWLTQALKVAIETRDAAIVDLMIRCDASRLQTQAAEWITASNKEQKDKILDWHVKLSRDSDLGLPLNRQDLAQLYKDITANLE